MIKILVTILFVLFLINVKCDNKDILDAMSSLNIIKLQNELKKQGILNHSIKKVLLKVSDDLIHQEAERNVWYKRYDGFAYIFLSIKLLVCSYIMFKKTGLIYEQTLCKNIRACVSGNPFLTESIYKNNSVYLPVIASLFLGMGTVSLHSGIAKLIKSNKYYDRALAAKAIIQKSPDIKGYAFDEE